MRNVLIVFVFFLSLFVCTSFIVEDTKAENDFFEWSVLTLLDKLGDNTNPHPLKSEMNKVNPKAGEQIIKNGFVTYKGGKTTKKQSKHFVCTSCHNLVKEDPDLLESNPESRLKFAIENDLPFLQGTTLYGAVNRTSFYNGDYYKKYGKLVDEARNDIRKAIQLCATECAQGRALEDWEIESVLAFMYELDLNVNDLEFSVVETDFIRKALNDTDDSPNEKAIELVKSKYLSGSPATFLEPPVQRKNLVFDNPDLEEGQQIYEKSCLHCHQDQKYSFLNLDNDQLTFKFLSRKAKGYGRQSLYQVTRYGVPSYKGKKSYMPHYTAEKLSESQLQNLHAYINYRARTSR